MELQFSASRQVNTAKHNLTTLTQTTKDNEHIDVELLFECEDSSSWPYQQQQHMFYFAVFGLVTCARNIVGRCSATIASWDLCFEKNV